MTAKKKIQITVDVLMVILFFLVMGYHITDTLLHEILGTVLLLCTIVHSILNFSWFTVLFKGRYTVKRSIHTAVNLMLLAAMVCTTAGAIMISRNVFTFLGFSGSSFGKLLHLCGAYWSFAMMGLHLGLHWVSFINRINRRIQVSRRSVFAARCLAAVIAGYGVYAFAIRQFGINLLGINEFTFWDYGKPVFLFFTDFFAIMVLFVFISHHGMKSLLHKKKAKRLLLALPESPGKSKDSEPAA